MATPDDKVIYQFDDESLLKFAKAIADAVATTYVKKIDLKAALEELKASNPEVFYQPKEPIYIMSASVPASKYYDGTTTTNCSNVVLATVTEKTKIDATQGKDFIAEANFDSADEGVHQVFVKVTLNDELSKRYILIDDTFVTEASIIPVPEIEPPPTVIDPDASEDPDVPDPDNPDDPDDPDESGGVS